MPGSHAEATALDKQQVHAYRALLSSLLATPASQAVRYSACAQAASHLSVPQAQHEQAIQHAAALTNQRMLQPSADVNVPQLSGSSHGNLAQASVSSVASSSIATTPSHQSHQYVSEAKPKVSEAKPKKAAASQPATPGTLEVEVVQGKVLLQQPAKSKAGRWLKQVLGSEDKSAQNAALGKRAVRVILSLKDAGKGSRKVAPPPDKCTPVGQAAVGQPVVWHAEGIFPVQSLSAVLRVTMLDGPEGKAAEQLVGKVDMPLHSLFELQQRRPGVFHTLNVPLYRKGSQAAAAQEPNETVGKATYNPVDETSTGTRGRVVCGYVQLQTKYVGPNTVTGSEGFTLEAPSTVVQGTGQQGSEMSEDWAQLGRASEQQLSKSTPVNPAQIDAIGLQPTAEVGSVTNKTCTSMVGEQLTDLGPGATHTDAALAGVVPAASVSDKSSVVAVPTWQQVLTNPAALGNDPTAAELQQIMQVVSWVWQLWQGDAFGKLGTDGQDTAGPTSAPSIAPAIKPPERTDGARSHAEGASSSSNFFMGTGQGWFGATAPTASEDVPLQKSRSQWKRKMHKAKQFLQGKPASSPGARQQGPAVEARNEESLAPRLVSEDILDSRPMPLILTLAQAQEANSIPVMQCALWDMFNNTPPGIAESAKASCADSVQTTATGTGSSQDAARSKLQEPLPGGLYWACLVSYAEQYKVPPHQLWLCLLAHMLDSWNEQAAGPMLWWQFDCVVRLLQPVIALQQQGGLDEAESALLQRVSAAAVQRCTHMLEYHYQLCGHQHLAMACASSAMTIMSMQEGSTNDASTTSGTTPSDQLEATQQLVQLHVRVGVQRRMQALLSSDTSDADNLPQASREGLGFHARQAEDFLQSAAAESSNIGDAAVSRLVMAVAVTIDDTLRDLLLRPIMSQWLDLPVITTNARYKLLVAALRQKFDVAACPPFHAAIQHLETLLYQLHNLLQEAGLGALDTDSEHDENQATLIDVKDLMASSVTKLIKAVGQRLLTWVDKTVDSELQSDLTSPLSNGTSSRLRPASGRPATPVATPLQPSWLASASSKHKHHYSRTVIELYKQLHAALELVAGRVMQHGTPQQNVEAAKQLYQILVSAVQRYICHVEWMIVSLLNGSSQSSTCTAMSRGTTIGGNNTTLARHSPPVTPPTGQHRRVRSDTLQALQTATLPTVASLGSLSSSQQAAHTPGAVKCDTSTVVTPALCVLLCSLQEVARQQALLERLLLHAVTHHGSVEGDEAVPQPGQGSRSGKSVRDSDGQSESSSDSTEHDKVAQMEPGEGLRGQVGPHVLELRVMGPPQERLSSIVQHCIHGVMAHIQTKLQERLGASLASAIQGTRSATAVADATSTSEGPHTTTLQAVQECLSEGLQCASNHLPPQLLYSLLLAGWPALTAAVHDVVIGRSGVLLLQPKELTELEQVLEDTADLLSASAITPQAGLQGAISDTEAPQEATPPTAQQLMDLSVSTRWLLGMAQQSTLQLIAQYKLLAPAAPPVQLSASLVGDAVDAASGGLDTSKKGLDAPGSKGVQIRMAAGTVKTGNAAAVVGVHRDSKPVQHTQKQQGLVTSPQIGTDTPDSSNSLDSMIKSSPLSGADQDVGTPYRPQTPEGMAVIDLLRLLWQRATSQSDVAAQTCLQQEAARIAALGSQLLGTSSTSTPKTAAAATGTQKPAEELLQIVLPASAGRQELEDLSCTYVVGCKIAGSDRQGLLMLCPTQLVFTTLAEDCRTLAGQTDSMSNRMMAALLLGGSDVPFVSDMTLCLPLEDVQRVDASIHKGSSALIISMLSHTRHLLYGFQPADRGDQLLNILRLQVMGSNTQLDRSLRGLDVSSAAALALDLPVGEALVRAFIGTLYGIVAETPGALYVCSSVLVCVTEETRTVIRLQDILSCRRSKDYRGVHWVKVESSQLPRPLWFNPGGEQPAAELLSAISSQQRTH